MNSTKYSQHITKIDAESEDEEKVASAKKKKKDINRPILVKIRE